jgi:hypothetical protein
MPVIEDHPPFGFGISARYAGEGGAERPVLELHDHLYNKHDQMSASVLTWPVPEPVYFAVEICASGEARTAITWHGWSESWLMA